MIKCSLIISTYNWPIALGFCLQSVLAQKQLPAEILIADDGSLNTTSELIARYQSFFPVPLLHIWQEDKGFYKTHIINKAVAAAAGDYIIQIDGDVLLDANFIKDHLLLAKKGHLVRGSRALLKQKITADILSNAIIPSSTFLKHHCRNKLNCLRNTTLARLLRHYKTGGKHKYNLLGCNMAYWKADFIKVNGFNENIIGWGCEDKEFAVRMLKAGCQKQALKMAGIVYHLHHPSRTWENIVLHQSIFQKSISTDAYRCKDGVDKYLHPTLASTQQRVAITNFRAPYPVNFIFNVFNGLRDY